MADSKSNNMLRTQNDVNEEFERISNERFDDYDSDSEDAPLLGGAGEGKKKDITAGENFNLSDYYKQNLLFPIFGSFIILSLFIVSYLVYSKKNLNTAPAIVKRKCYRLFFIYLVFCVATFGIWTLLQYMNMIFNSKLFAYIANPLFFVSLLLVIWFLPVEPGRYIETTVWNHKNNIIKNPSVLCVILIYMVIFFLLYFFGGVSNYKGESDAVSKGFNQYGSIYVALMVVIPFALLLCRGMSLVFPNANLWFARLRMVNFEEGEDQVQHIEKNCAEARRRAADETRTLEEEQNRIAMSMEQFNNLLEELEEGVESIGRDYWPDETDLPFSGCLRK